MNGPGDENPEGGRAYCASADHLPAALGRFHTHLVDVLQRISMRPVKRAIELPPWMWKSLLADTPLRSDFGPHHHAPLTHL